MSKNVLNEDGEITTHDVATGFIAHLHDGEGGSVSFWAPTEERAKEKAENHREEQ